MECRHEVSHSLYHPLLWIIRITNTTRGRGTLYTEGEGHTIQHTYRGEGHIIYRGRGTPYSIHTEGEGHIIYSTHTEGRGTLYSIHTEREGHIIQYTYREGEGDYTVYIQRGRGTLYRIYRRGGAYDIEGRDTIANTAIIQDGGHNAAIQRTQDQVGVSV